MDLWRHVTKQVLTPSTSGASGKWPCAARERREKAEALWQELGAEDLGTEIYGTDPEPCQRQLGTARHTGVAPRRRIQRRRTAPRRARRRRLRRRSPGSISTIRYEKKLYVKNFCEKS